MDFFGITAILVIVLAIALAFLAIRKIGDAIDGRRETNDYGGNPRPVGTYDSEDLGKRIDAFRSSYKEPIVWKAGE